MGATLEVRWSWGKTWWWCKWDGKLSADGSRAKRRMPRRTWRAVLGRGGLSGKASTVKGDLRVSYSMVPVRWQTRSSRWQSCRCSDFPRDSCEYVSLQQPMLGARYLTGALSESKGICGIRSLPGMLLDQPASSTNSSSALQHAARSSS
jgi:hypothetical protein